MYTVRFMSHGRFKDPVSATLAGVKDFFRTQEFKNHLTDKDRLDGKTCLVTGANRGLGYAVAVELAKRGGHIIMACKSEIPEAGERVGTISGSQAVEMLHADFSDVDSIHGLCDELEKRGVKLDVVILNAGVTPPKSRQNKHGQDLMFAVNYLANFILVNRLIKTGVIPNGTYAGNRKEKPSRIIFISSDSHQGASAVDWEEFGTYKPYGVKKAINNYSYFKLLINILATELSRRLSPNGRVDVAVNVICPGPVNTDIIREAPLALRLVLRSIFTVFFQAPKKAALPIAYMAASDELEDKTNFYMHMFNTKRMDEKAYDAADGARLWDESNNVWRKIDEKASAFGI
jgi:NAD(P)-dependent dehydrogenase (short-subunit alcohol dehydrogenase family)